VVHVPKIVRHLEAAEEVRKVIVEMDFVMQMKTVIFVPKIVAVEAEVCGGCG
jgi:hypothetical protein